MWFTMFGVFGTAKQVVSLVYAVAGVGWLESSLLCNYLLYRVLLERLIVNRPHPWGLLVTFIELIRNQSYRFWGHDFVHCSPEIERLFETVARSCNQNRSQQQSTGSVAPSTNSAPNNIRTDATPASTEISAAM